ncbi:MAG: hypothetical protein ABI210_06225, partial [Abditibacteriaceae bacterium]
VIIAIAYSALNIYATAQLNHQLNLIRQKGEPLTLAEAAPQKIPDSQNAGILYERAEKALKLKRKQQYISEGLSQKEKDTILAQNTAVITLIRQATEKPDCRFNVVDWSHPFTYLIPGAEYMGQFASLLSWQASKEAESGNTNSAFQDVKRIYIMAGQLSKDPFTMSAIVTGFIETTANDTLAKVLLHGSLSASQARLFNSSVPVIDWNTVWYRSLITERTFTLEVYRNTPQLMGNLGENRTFFFKLTWLLWRSLPPLQKLDETYSLQIWHEILDNAGKLRSPFTLTSKPNVDKEIMHAPWYAIASKNLLPIGNFQQRSNRSDAQRQEREIAFALAAYHTKYHQYPTTLAPAEKLWKSTFPLDPYSNKPFRYKSDGKTFLLYSVGLDGKDDGGQRREFRGSFIKQDIVWGH